MKLDISEDIKSKITQNRSKHFLQKNSFDGKINKKLHKKIYIKKNAYARDVCLKNLIWAGYFKILR